MTADLTRWRGVVDLVVDAVEHGSGAVERVHQWTAKKPFQLLGALPRLARPARAVGLAQSAAIAATYETVRQVARVAGVAVRLGLEVAGRRGAEGGAALPAHPVPETAPPAPGSPEAGGG